jgi:hypothetical protein
LDTGLTTDIKNAFIAYDTDARRQLLQLNPLQGTDSEKQMCKELGWDLVELYFDFVTGDEVQVFHKHFAICPMPCRRLCEHS